jgi:hypothetical protein
VNIHKKIFTKINLKNEVEKRIENIKPIVEKFSAVVVADQKINENGNQNDA